MKLTKKELEILMEHISERLKEEEGEWGLKFNRIYDKLFKEWSRLK